MVILKERRWIGIEYIVANLKISVWYYIVAVIILIILLSCTKKLGFSLLIPYVFLVFATTLFSRTVRDAHYEIIPFDSYRNALIDTEIREEILCNILMFLPIGFLLPETLREFGKEYSFGKCILYGLLISVFIELLQLLFQSGLCETDDVISNTLGLMIGSGLFVCGGKAFHLLFGEYVKG